MTIDYEGNHFDYENCIFEPVCDAAWEELMASA
jgi:hypothetical protein